MEIETADQSSSSFKMEIETADQSSSSFKVPKSLPPHDDSVIKNAVASSVADKDVTKDDKSDSKKKISNSGKHVDVPLPYKEPDWGGVPPLDYSFEIIKNGTVVETYNIENTYIVFGRLPICNLIFEHPSVSRYHAIVQYCQGDSDHQKGFYLYDLGSTHGTFLNKQKITPKIYYKLKVGYVIKFGGSSRLHIFQGPEENNEVEEKKVAVKVEEDVCTWGMGEDAEEEEDLSENPFALSTPNEDLYLDDPKKTLKNWFEREGYELEYDVEEKGFKTFACRIQLPIDTPTGDFMAVEASVTGKKKEAVIACALEACRTLDRLGLLRQSHQESRQKKKKKWEENDYYDSDEDTFLDRTGTIEKKREMRKKIEKKNTVETYESIEAKLKIVCEEIDEITNKLSVSKNTTMSESNSEADSLEVYMSNLSDNKDCDKIERRKLRFRLQEAEKEKAHLEKLAAITRPNKLPPVVKYPGMIGKRLKSKLQIPLAKPEKISPPSIKSSDDKEEEEVEEESDSENMIVESSNDTTVSTDVTINQEKNSKENSKTYGLILNAAQKDEESTSSSTKQNLESLTGFANKCKAFKNVEPPNDAILPLKKKKKDKQVEQNVDVYTVGNSDYTTWVPPSGQTGDGITHLNAKYGY